MKTVLIIDDNREFSDIAALSLMNEEYDVLQASSVHDAFEILHREEVDLIVCDLNLPFINGEEQKNFEYSCKTGVWTIRELRGLYPDLPIMALTSLAPSDLDAIRAQLAVTTAFTKPARSQELVSMVQRMLQNDLALMFH